MRDGSAHQRDPRLGSAPRPGEEKEGGGGGGGGRRGRRKEEWESKSRTPHLGEEKQT